ncbi:hypothetical protein ACFQY5_36000 [Paeniroseomonas aquatica]|uniref:Mobilization protein n=1 Tax=Paeniroseomonas aquatica TaxID=373043 RepID=A0ABT8AFV5_9PROT|nr:hypothetical protein [Paeniroseomonas aquatica]MDN3568718.1 hypothetical protein [Paeniroseomonas aquatica]
MAKPASTERKKPGRKSETPAQRLERLERDIAAARQAVADAEQRKLATIGAAVLAEAGDNPSFMDELQRLLRARVSTKAGKADIASILAHPSTNTEPAAPVS